MENYDMAAESAGGAALIKICWAKASAFIQIYGLKATLGMVGAAMLYIVLPPVKQDGSFDKHEFVVRLACAGVFSCMFGDSAYALLIEYLPRVAANLGGKPVDIMVGAPAWWITRAIALWMQRRSGKDIAEVVREVKEST